LVASVQLTFAALAVLDESAADATRTVAARQLALRRNRHR